MTRAVTTTTVTVIGRHWGCYTEIDTLSHLNLLLTSVCWMFSIICIFYFSFFKGTIIGFRVSKCAPSTNEPRPTLIPSCQHSSAFGGSGCFFSLKCLQEPGTWAKVKLGTSSLMWKQFVEDAKEMSVKQRKDGNPLHPSGKQGQSPGLSSPFFK